MVFYQYHNAVQLLSARSRDGPGQWERLTHHASCADDHGACTVLMATSQKRSLVLRRHSAITAVTLRLIPSKILKKLEESDWIPGAWIASETFPTSDAVSGL
ncbi:Cy162 [Cynomolgus cytomegalovirus]|nr:Cy162 [Cynomolgus cytomegalovirus]